jgi:hypothetical protein
MSESFCSRAASTKPAITVCSPGFARFFLTEVTGRFLRGVLADLSKWHNDQAQYTSDSQTVTRGTVVYHPGFIQKWTSKPIDQGDQLEWGTEFRRLIRKWHLKLSKAGISRLFLSIPNIVP